MDIGNYVGRSRELDDDTKLDVINNHWKPPSSFNFPFREFGSKTPIRRRFSTKWLQRWSWLCYSKLYDGAFCLGCVLLGDQTGHNGSKLSKLFKEPLINWQSAATRLEDHDKNSALHKDAMLRLTSFKNVMLGNVKGIDEQADNLRSERIQYNRAIVSSIVETVILAGRQNIALRGHRDDSQHYLSPNPGNFQALLNYRIQGGDTKLGDHFVNAPRNATYRSKTIQNKIVKICGQQIQRKLVAEINNSGNSPFYSVLADEATDCGKKEQMPIVIRYVDSKNEINERFIKFVNCDTGMTGLALAKNIEDTLDEVGLPLENCRGQGYDGASAMSSMRKGVSGRILSKNPKALYVHCASHRLNLCVAKACSIVSIRRMLDHAKSVANFFSYSVKRTQFLSEKMSACGITSARLATPSMTRWVERITSLDGLVDAHEAVVEVLEEMKFDVDKKWNASTSSDATSLLHICTSFEFIVALMITTHILDYTMPLTRRLQQRKIDIVKSLQCINLLKETINQLRASVEEIHDKFYQQAVEMAKKVNVDESLPRTCKVQTLRENYPVETPRDYYRVRITIPFLDHLKEEIEDRFPPEKCNLYNGFYAIPSILLTTKDVCWKTEFLKFLSVYRDDISDYRVVSSELDMWETNWKKGIVKVVYESVADTLKNIDEIAFPNIYVALKILAVTPVTTCECERSVSALRRLKTWLRNTMEEERLNGLAMMHINNDITIEVNKVVDTFARKNNTRMQLLDIFDDVNNEEENNRK